MIRQRPWFIAAVLVALPSCDEAAADWASCQAATDRRSQITACEAAKKKDPTSASGIAATKRLHEIDEQEERERHDDRVSAALRSLADFRGTEKDIADTIDTVDKLGQSGDADLADRQLAVAEATINKYAKTDVAMAPEYLTLRKRVLAARTKLTPLLAKWHYDHPTVDDLAARCLVQSAAVDALFAQAQAALNRGDYATVNATLPKVDPALDRWRATFNLFPDSRVAVLRCRAPRRPD